MLLNHKKKYVLELLERSNFPIILFFLMQQTPRAIVVKCDGSVYDVDVEWCAKPALRGAKLDNTVFCQLWLKNMCCIAQAGGGWILWYFHTYVVIFWVQNFEFQYFKN